jgi:hypothetical protein
MSGGQPCTDVVRRSSELLTCTSPLGAEFMLGGNSENGTMVHQDHEAPIRVSVDGVSSTGRIVFTRTSKIDSNVTEFEYLPPTVLSVEPTDGVGLVALDGAAAGPAFGYRNVTIRGEHYGTKNRGSVIALIGGRPCVETEWVDRKTVSLVGHYLYFLTSDTYPFSIYRAGDLLDSCLVNGRESGARRGQGGARDRRSLCRRDGGGR